MEEFNEEIKYRKVRTLLIMACLMSVEASIGYCSYIILPNLITKTILILFTFSVIFHAVLYFLYSRLNKLNLTNQHLFVLLIYLIFFIIAIYNPFDFLYMWAYLLYFPIIIGLIENESTYKVWSVLYMLLYAAFIITNNYDNGQFLSGNSLLLVIQILLATGSILVGYIIVNYLSFVESLYIRDNENKIKEHAVKVLSTLIPIVETKTYTTKNEILEMSEIMKGVIKKLPTSKVRDWEIEFLSLLHFVSRIELPDYLFEKHEALTEYEMKIVQNHCMFGCTLLRDFKSFII